MRSTFIYPYKPGSHAARELAQELGVRRISHTNSRFRGNPDKTIINYGATRLPEEVEKCRVLNPVSAVRRTSDKLRFFRHAGETDAFRVPPWFEDWMEALEYGDENDCDIVVRHILNGHSGAGIEIRSPGYHMPEEAPLYTAYVPKKQEYRVHVFQGSVLDVQRKARRRDVADDEVNWKVRNNDNGFVFARNGDALGDVPEDVLNQATRAVTSLGLDFGAADIIYNDRRGLAYVLEVNTAPGLVGTTLENYGRAFRELLS